MRSAHLSGWARIETRFLRWCRPGGKVAPTFRGGRGLKLERTYPHPAARLVAPTFRGGRGLKQKIVDDVSLVLARSAHLSGWARIETVKTIWISGMSVVAPTFRGGRGLKQAYGIDLAGGVGVAPTFRGGRGLKHCVVTSPPYWSLVAPTFRGGRGLKQDFPGREGRERQVAPTFRGGRGLKQTSWGHPSSASPGSAHLSGWARIETPGHTSRRYAP